MSAAAQACPMTRREVIDRYFLEHRAKLLDLAAFLDRVDRAAASSGGSATVEAASSNADLPDHRLASLLDAVALLSDGGPDRARRILELFSDPTTTPIAAAGTKGATGAYPAYRPRAVEASDDEDLNLL